MLGEGGDRQNSAMSEGSPTVQVSLIGPVEIRHDNRWLSPGTARQRCVLAALAWEPRRLVDTDMLIDRVWGDQPPPAALQTLYSYVSRLRRQLSPSPASEPALARGAGGYTLLLADDQVDVTQFAMRVRGAQAAAAAGDDRTAAERYASALSLARGRPLAGIAGRWAEHVAFTISERYWTAAQESAECRLRLGEYAEVAADLREFVAEQPAREGLVAQLMLALARLGRGADALRVYEHCRRELQERYAVRPGARLVELARWIGRHDLDAPVPLVKTDAPARSVGTRANTHRGGPVPVPRQLPAPAACFTGRGAELSLLDQLLDGPVYVATIVGPPGVGKSDPGM
jgi:DNA-binding SARP family transcriptional activator